MQVLLVNPEHGALPEGTGDLLDKIGWNVTSVSNYADALRTVRQQPIDAVIVSQPVPDNSVAVPNPDFNALIRLIDNRRLAAVVLSDRPPSIQTDPRSLLDVVGKDICLAELRGRLVMIGRYHETVQRLERELRNMEKLGKRLNRHFREIDQEMRLAARLQRDFLPRVKDPIGNIQFASLYRPANGVSGDMFDIFRIDEEHTGFYVADAIGHGMAAGLLTIFIKRAMVSKRVEAGRHVVLSPSEAIASLNEALTDQALPNCQFVTACYATFNHRTLNLRYARGGHPYPLLISSDGLISELKTPGGLLGLFKDDDFPTLETRLRPGDKLLLFSDGVELAFQSAEGQPFDSAAYQKTFESFAHLPIAEMIRRIEIRLDSEAGSLNPQDDVTIVGMEVLAS